jgi:hypothetical protein
MRNQTPVLWEAEHIKGHQDRTTPVQELSRKARLNVEADRIAGAYWIHLVSRNEVMPTPKVHEIFGEEWQLWNGDQKISHPSNQALYSIFQDPQTDMWWRREGHISAEAREVIDHEATAEVMLSLSAPNRKYVTKTASENYGIGKTLVEWKHQTDPKCPRCQQRVETSGHVQQCQGYAAEAVFQKSIGNVEEFLVKEQTRPDLQDAVVQCLTKWRAQKPIRLAEYQSDVQEVIRQQHTIGWLDMLECLPAKGWRQLQQQYYQEHATRKSSKKWIRGLLQQLHHLGRKMWKHRCDVKANITKPQEHEHVELMHDEIERQFVQGSDELLPGDKSILDYSILSLLQRSLAYKKGWLARVWAARQRARRMASRDDTLIVQSSEARRIAHWMKTHRDRPKWKEKIQQKKGSDEEMEDTAPAMEEYIDDQEYLRPIIGEDIRWRPGEQLVLQDVEMCDQPYTTGSQQPDALQENPRGEYHCHFQLCQSPDRL